ncbi:hypothetical protein ILYODFUR_025971, partial [Ilyodon furcidens]
SSSWPLWELHGSFLPGWGTSYGWGRGAVLCAPDPPQDPAKPSIDRGDVYDCPHVAHHLTYWGTQKLLQWRHPAWLYRCRDTHLTHILQRDSAHQHFCYP